VKLSKINTINGHYKLMKNDVKKKTNYGKKLRLTSVKNLFNHNDNNCTIMPRTKSKQNIQDIINTPKPKLSIDIAENENIDDLI